MNRIATTLSIAAAFAAGCAVTHLTRPALAADEHHGADHPHPGPLRRRNQPGQCRRHALQDFCGRRRRHGFDPGGQSSQAPACQLQRDPVHPRRHRHDLARRQGSADQPGDLIIIPGHPRRHQGRQQADQGAGHQRRRRRLPTIPSCSVEECQSSSSREGGDP